jgi:hypothetical protein
VNGLGKIWKPVSGKEAELRRSFWKVKMDEVNDTPTPHQRSGLARAESLSPARRRKIARKAAHSRWGIYTPVEKLATNLVIEYAEIFKGRPDLFAEVSLPLLEWLFGGQVAEGMEQVAVWATLANEGDQ